MGVLVSFRRVEGTFGVVCSGLPFMLPLDTVVSDFLAVEGVCRLGAGWH